MARSFSQFLLAVAVAVVVGGSAQAQDTPLKEAVTMLRLGKTDEGVAKLKEILASDPSNTQALELYRSVSQDEWYMLMTTQGEAQKIAQSLLERARADMKRHSRDEAAIAGLVATATDKSADHGARRSAISKLIQEHGEFAVPALVEKLGNADDVDGQIHAMSALVDLRSVAVLPLIAALQSSNEQLVVNAASTLRHINDDRALPIMAHLASDDRLPIREIAGRYIARKNVKAGDAMTLLLGQSLNYLKGIVPQGAYSEVVWTWNGEKLVPVDVPAPLYPSELAKGVAAQAVAIAPSNVAARAMLAEANLAQANLIEVSIQKGDEAMKALEPMASEFKVAALATGTDALRAALEGGLREDLAPVALGAIGALQMVETRETVGQSPLLAAIDSTDKRVRYAAADAIVKATGGLDVPMADRVAAVLGEAVTEQAVRVVQVVAPEAMSKGAVAAAGNVRGLAVDATSTAKGGVRKMLINPNVDVLVINESLPDGMSEDVIGIVRKDPRLANVKIVVVCKDEEKARAAFGENVTYLVGSLTGESLVSEVNKALAGVADADGSRAEAFAATASASLATLAANGKGATTAVLGNLAAQLDRGDAVSVPAAKALGYDGGAAELGALAAALGGSGSVELKKVVAESIGNICRRLGNCPDEAAMALIGALEANQDVGLRTAIGVALSRVSLAPKKHAELLQKLQRVAAGAASEG